MNILLDTKVLSEPMRQQPDAAVMAEIEAGGHQLHTASVVIHELRYGVQRLPKRRRRQRLDHCIQAVLARGLTVLADDTTSALWHGEQRASLEARGVKPPFADGQIAAIAATQGLVLVTRNTSDFELFDGLQLLHWFSQR
jgi:tRNA(fMet)-specific endonuclease VapC